MDGLDRHLATRLRALMAESGTRQDDLARAMSQLGLRWSASRVTSVVTGRGTLSLLEVAGLCAALGRPLSDLLGDQDGTVQLPRTGTVPIGHVVAALLSGASDWVEQQAAQQATVAALSGWGPHSELTVKAAKRLAVTPAVVDHVAEQLWGRILPVERDWRVQPQEGESARALQARRGHVSRALLAELAAGLRERGHELRDGTDEKGQEE